MIKFVKELYKKNLIKNILMIVVFSISIYMTNMSLYSLYTEERLNSYIEQIPKYSYYLTAIGESGLTNEKLELLSKKYNFSYSNLSIELSVDIDGIETVEYVMNDVMSNFRLKLREGKWFSKQSITKKECIIAGKLSNKYKIGDKIKCNGEQLEVIGKLEEPYVMDLEYSSKNISYYDLLHPYNNLCIRTEEVDMNTSLSKLIISDSKLDEAEFSNENLILESFDDIQMNTRKELQKSVISNSFFVALIIIALLVSCFTLIYSTVYYNRDAIEIFRICGASKAKIIFVLIGQTLITMIICMIIISIVLTLLGNNIFFNDLFGSNYLLHFVWIIIYFSIVICAEIIYIITVILRRGIFIND